MTNLLSNAIKFTEKGHVHCFIRRARGGERISSQLLVQGEALGEKGGESGGNSGGALLPKVTSLTLSGTPAVESVNSWQNVQDLVGTTAGVGPGELVVLEGESIRLVISVEVGLLPPHSTF